MVFGPILGILAIWLFILFSSSPPFNPSIAMVSGTEYISGELGQVIIRVADRDGAGIGNSRCLVSVAYPDKTFFLKDILMRPSLERGNYYYTFITPNLTGIYEEMISCEGEQGKQSYRLSVSSSFHVSTALNYIMEMVKLQKIQYGELMLKMNDSERKLGDMITNEIERSQQEILTQIQEDVVINLTERITTIEGRFAALGSSMEEIFTR